ncbi:MAG: flagellar basal body-associated protein FliL [Nitrosospira sp.]|nr:flagellar basal body-associated protein FliL [Nitrosospira sp.]
MAARPSRSENGSAATPGDRERGKGKRVLVIALCVLLAAAGGGGATWYFTRTEGAMTHSEKPKPPIFLSLDTFTVNLQSEHSDQHLQTSLTLKVEDDRTVELIKLHMPEVRNRILLLLSSKAALQIATIEGKRKLASELTAEINQPFTEGRPGQSVESVLFTSFVIQ